MARRAKRQGPDNHDRWMVSYADFITLLFAFFVVMYGISSVNEGKYKVFSGSMTQAFGKQAGTGDAGTGLSEEEMYFKALIERRNARLAEKYIKQQERMKRLSAALNSKLASFVNKGAMSVTQTDRGVTLDINASMLFQQGDATLQAEAVTTLTDVAKILAEEAMPVEVEGYTDNLPIATAQFPSNWELSSARASSVVRLFIEQGLTADHLKAIGHADNDPVASNDTIEGRARNRRVTVTVLAPPPEAAISTGAN
ncbi:MAG: flagellar motor protein MotD [Gammaproteobacteria bacterium]|nr:flagellar motor protein MotD [Sideroxydans sp.]MBU3902932.1 flagellar motor protein MotD [Gammaproteobacteria bacterium]MBU4045615.1 flagellar motor protein MotD [Gammaproteobacteria bacterium]MBU4150177.1 flagellar motor protein MotD [Gammaproteobacteria bacterium]